VTICKFARDGMNVRLLEARELLNKIKQEEPGDGIPRVPSSFSLTLRGLIYVSLYGAIEYAVTHGTQGFINYLCGLNVNTKHLEYSLHSIALDSQLTSARDAGEKKKWEARRAIFSGFDLGASCSIPDTVFGTFLHNVYPKTILEIFLCLGIKKPATAMERDIGYFKEITEKRNAVAHGREAASDVGKGLTAQDAEVRLNATYDICSYFLDAVEEHASEFRFVRSRYRSTYRRANEN
jgi:hypothetical protein